MYKHLSQADSASLEPCGVRMKDMNYVYMSTCMTALCRHVNKNKSQGGGGGVGVRGPGSYICVCNTILANNPPTSPPGHIPQQRDHDQLTLYSTAMQS